MRVGVSAHVARIFGVEKLGATQPRHSHKHPSFSFYCVPCGIAVKVYSLTTGDLVRTLLADRAVLSVVRNPLSSLQVNMHVHTETHTHSHTQPDTHSTTTIYSQLFPSLDYCFDCRRHFCVGFVGGSSSAAIEVSLCGRRHLHCWEHVVLEHNHNSADKM